MDQILYDYLIKVGYDDDDIKFLCRVCPGLEIISGERALANLAAVVRAGYPESDIDGLISLNPNFLLNNPADTARKLAQISDDIEVALKDNPELLD